MGFEYKDVYGWNKESFFILRKMYIIKINKKYIYNHDISWK